MRLADADVLPFEFTDFAETMQTYVKQLKNLLKEKQDEIGERNRQIEEGVFQAVNDPRRPTVAPKMESVPPPFLNFAPLDNAVTELAKSADAYKKAYEQASAKTDFGKLSASELNRMLGKNEQQLTREEGLPDGRGSSTKSTRRGSTPATKPKLCRRCGKRWSRSAGSKPKKRLWLSPKCCKERQSTFPRRPRNCRRCIRIKRPGKAFRRVPWQSVSQEPRHSFLQPCDRRLWPPRHEWGITLLC